MKRESINYTVHNYGGTGRFKDYVLSNGIQLRKIKTLEGNTTYRLSGKYKENAGAKMYFDTNTMLLLLKIIMAEMPLGGALYGEIK